ncbi:MAG: KGK domain-containing protein, partial [Cyanobacteriota bacterium]
TPELLKFALAQFGKALGNWSWIGPGEGIGGELLKIGGSRWVPGRIRFRVIMEFRPNEPEPPDPPKSGLDEFRQ